MKNYKVCIDFKAGPSFAPEVEAESKSQAKADAKELAKWSGFTGPIRVITVREIA